MRKEEECERMITLVTGGCGSGKSEYAERLAAESGCPRRWYVATMEVYGEEGRQKVERHRRQRAGKGFRTVECPRGLETVRIPGGPEGTAVLLECVSNLAANEMFGGRDLPAGSRGPDRGKGPDGGKSLSRPAYEAVMAGIKSLARRCGELVIVTNEVGGDGIAYEAETMEYIRLMGRINAGLAKLADRVVEVVYGIPVVLKGEADAAGVSREHTGRTAGEGDKL